MGYQVALAKAWSDLANLAQEADYSVRFLADNYAISVKHKRLSLQSCDIPVKTHLSILILHYLIRKLKGLPLVKGEWVSFKELSGGQGYYPVFQKRVIDPIQSKYRTGPEALLESSGRFKAKRAELADVSVILDVLDSVPILITFWRGDEEFGPQANVLFDKSISEILCTEDIVVLAEIVAYSI